jgi:nucleoside permease NupC
LKKANDKLESNFAKVDTNAIEAATRGASEGLSLALNVAAMLIAFTALVYMANGVVGWLASLLGYHITLQLGVGFQGADIAERWVEKSRRRLTAQKDSPVGPLRLQLG